MAYLKQHPALKLSQPVSNDSLKKIIRIITPKTLFGQLFPRKYKFIENDNNPKIKIPRK